MMRTALVFFTLCLSVVALQAQSIKINISGLKTANGSVRLAFYNTSKGFDNEKALFNKTVSKSTVVNGALSVTYSGLKPGVYGIAILDDENNNQKMDYGIILPKEGFGFSNYYHTGMSRPKFESFDFILGSEDQVVEIRVRYL